ncbi:MAG: hypothetical protein ABIH36_03270 [bacterium]
MVALDPDSMFEKVVEWTVFIWGPFYAVFYIIRLVVSELLKREED